MSYQPLERFEAIELDMITQRGGECRGRRENVSHQELPLCRLWKGSEEPIKKEKGTISEKEKTRLGGEWGVILEQEGREPFKRIKCCRGSIKKD